MDWFDVVQGSEECLGLMSTVINVCVPRNARSLLVSWGKPSCSEMTLLRGFIREDVRNKSAVLAHCKVSRNVVRDV